MIRTRSVISFIGLLVIVIAFIWLWTHPRLNYAAESVRCREAYARASSRADSARVDQMFGFSQTRGNDNPIRCGELRAAGYL